MDFVGLTVAISALEKTLRESASGWRNEEALSAIKKLVLVIRHDCDGESYILEEIGTIDTIADVLYSPRKAQSYGGSERVKETMLAACKSIRDRVSYLERTAN